MDEDNEFSLSLKEDEGLNPQALAMSDEDWEYLCYWSDHSTN